VGLQQTDFYLSNANLSYARLSYANLSGAWLHNSIIIGIKSYANIVCKNSDFNDSVIDNQNLAIFVTNAMAKNVPRAAKDKRELEVQLKNKGYGDEFVRQMLERSSLLQKTY
jgi:hypothetical protein